MRYQIISDKGAVEPNTVKLLEEKITKQIGKVERLVGHYRKPIVLEVHVKKPGANTYLVSYLADLVSKPVISKTSGIEAGEAAAKAFEGFIQALVQQLKMERRLHQRRRTEALDMRTADVMEPLVELKKDEAKDAFVSLLQKSFPNLVGYFRRQMKLAAMTHTLRRQGLNAEDLVAELYLKLYDRMDEDEIRKSGTLYAWVLIHADLMMTDFLRMHALTEHESVERLAMAETRTMEESYSREADGDYIMNEDLDDPAYQNFDPEYEASLQHFYDHFTDEDEADRITDEADREVTDEERLVAVHNLMYSLSDFKRSIYDLYLFEGLSEEDIALVKRTDVATVQKALDEVKRFMKEAIG